MIEYNTLVVLVGVSLLAASAGLVGCFAMLRRRALMGDALAHAALPGVVLAYLLYREYHLPVLLAGAFATGLLGVQVVAVLDRWTRIKEDAAIGIVLSVFFGAGIVLLRVVPEGTASGLNAFILGKTAGMVARDVYLIAAAALLFVVLVLLFYKEFQLVVFDPDFAQAQGWPALRLELLLMALVALTVVIGLPAVGVVMIAALLIVP
ncbi:MAG: metal ABC transporter permease, partial [Gemmataceae bacterium]